MPFQVHINDVVQSSTKPYEKAIREIMDSMKQLQRIGTYSEYAPSFDLSMSLTRKHVGTALGEIWYYCANNDLPPLNMLVVREDTGLPGTGIISWYEDTFGTMSCYEEFCSWNGKLSELMLQRKVIVIV